MKCALDAWKNTYMVEAAFDNPSRGPILKKLSEWFVSNSVIYGFIAVIVYLACVGIYLSETGDMERKSSLMVALLFMIVGVIIYRLIEMKLLYRELKKTFDTKSDFLIFLSTIAYNRYTQMGNVLLDDVIKDMKELERNGTKTIFFFKYFYILTVNRKNLITDSNVI